jgi:hypothetical protein
MVLGVLWEVIRSPEWNFRNGIGALIKGAREFLALLAC